LRLEGMGMVGPSSSESSRLHSIRPCAQNLVGVVHTGLAQVRVWVRVHEEYFHNRGRGWGATVQIWVWGRTVAV